jgi:Uma2 family endonuclease
MATATITPETVQATAQIPVEPVKGDQHVVFLGIGWEGYEILLKVQGEKGRPQLICLNGDVLLMSPSRIHERITDRLGLFVREIVVELDIPCEPTRETTFRRPDLEVGVQPDDSFYLANYRAMAAKVGKEDVDLRVDPPPDLVIEVVHTHSAKDAVEVLRRLGVPEVWVGDVEHGLRILVLSNDGQYHESNKSVCFPFLTAAEIFEWAARPGMASMTQWVKQLRQWTREVLVPRVQEPDK